MAFCRKAFIKIIGVGFALLVQLNRAMRRPQDVERATRSDLHAFSLYMLKEETLKPADAGRSIGANSEKNGNKQEGLT